MPVTVIDHSGKSLWSSFGEYRHAGTLFLFLVLRDIRLRYRQSVFGVGWAVVQPLSPMLIFAPVFSRFNLTTSTLPYPLYVLSGFAPWVFIGNAVTEPVPPS